MWGNILSTQEGYPMYVHQTSKMCSENILDFQYTIFWGISLKKLDIPRNIALYIASFIFTFIFFILLLWSEIITNVEWISLRLDSTIRVFTNVRIFLGIPMEKRKKNGTRLLERRISTGYSWKSQGYPSLSSASAIFLLYFPWILVEISLG